MKGFFIVLFTALILIMFFLAMWPIADLSSEIESLKLAPERLLCERKAPTAISLNYYTDKEIGWQAIFAGRNHKDFLLGFIQFSKTTPQRRFIEFVFVGTKWKLAKELTLEENLIFKKDNAYSKEENEFMGSCIEKIFEYLEKKKEEKKLYTPVTRSF